MTVKELIEELKTLNQDNKIIVCAKDCETPEISVLDYCHCGAKMDRKEDAGK